MNPKKCLLCLLYIYIMIYCIYDKQNIDTVIYIYLDGGFNPSEKYESQMGLLFPIYGKITNVPNHQPDNIN